MILRLHCKKIILEDKTEISNDIIIAGAIEFLPKAKYSKVSVFSDHA